MPAGDEIGLAAGDRPDLRPPRVRRPTGVIALVFSAGLLITSAVTWTSWYLNNHNERRLLDRQTQQVGLVLAAAIPSTQTPLATAAEIAQVTDGDPTRFMRFIAPYVGAKGQFLMAALWQVDGSTVRRVAGVGTPAEFVVSSPAARSFVQKAFHRSGFIVTPILGGSSPRIGYGLALAGATHHFLIYAEHAIPANRQSPIAKNSAFADLFYAIYLGRSERPQDLLTTDFSHLPVTGGSAKVSVPFGDTYLTVETAAAGPLGGTLPGRLPWIFAALGLLLSVIATWTAGRLVKRRRLAEQSTEEIGRLYGELGQLFGHQRTIAETLQHALLPQDTPEIGGVQIAARYVPGTSGVDIGGDWYSVTAVDDDRFAFVVGDVSGRGLSAATVMAGLRFTMRAYALEGYSAATILEKCAGQLNIVDDGHFATALVGVVDAKDHTITMANAGHLPPLVIAGGRAEYIELPTGVPLGVAGGRYSAARVTIDPGSTLLAFTDGLVERRGESLDVGLRRLQQAIRDEDCPLDELLTTVISELSSDVGEDDIAILGMRWEK